MIGWLDGDRCLIWMAYQLLVVSKVDESSSMAWEDIYAIVLNNSEVLTCNDLLDTSRSIGTRTRQSNSSLSLLALSTGVGSEMFMLGSAESRRLGSCGIPPTPLPEFLTRVADGPSIEVAISSAEGETWPVPESGIASSVCWRGCAALFGADRV